MASGDTPKPTDEELLERQAALQAEARDFVAEHGIERLLEGLGRVIPVGSAVTGLMVWRDLDYMVDAPGAAAGDVWEGLRPLLHACRQLVYADETGELAGEAAPFERHYFVFRLDGWKLDISVWTNGSPEEVERHQEKLDALDASTRLAILRIKDARHERPDYPEVVGGFEVYEAVLEHGIRTAEEFELYLGRGRQR
ncbi:MAG TPA: hypothetical protein VFP09_04365 [Desertimonas sp.]|nr:hypothetical protein [Desertimonas sp.]